VTIRFGLPPANGGSPIVSYPIRGGGQTIRVTADTFAGNSAPASV
jgi:hypothetical protein